MRRGGGGEWRLRFAVSAGGLGLAVLVGVVQGLPGHDLVGLVALAFGVALVLGAIGQVALTLGQTASFRAQTLVVALMSVGATALGRWPRLAPCSSPPTT